MNAQYLAVGKQYYCPYHTFPVTFVTGTDTQGLVIVTTSTGAYQIVAPYDLEEIPVRYTVEIRPPKAGERVLSGNGLVLRQVQDRRMGQPAVVIVSE